MGSPKNITILILLLFIILTSTLLGSCTFPFSPHLKRQRRIKKEGPAIYISSSPSILVNQKVLIYPVRLGPNSGELGFNMSIYIKNCMEKWHLFSKIDIASTACNDVFSAIKNAKKLGYHYIIWLDCPILLPPGVNPDEPGEMKINFRIINTQTQNTCWYITETIFWFNDYSSWIINDSSQEIPKAIKTMLTIICNDWQSIIIPNKNNKKAGLITRFLSKLSKNLNLSNTSAIMAMHKFL